VGDADIAGHARRESAHVAVGIEADFFLADHRAKGIAGLAHGIFARAVAGGGERCGRRRLPGRCRCRQQQ
jgi:hypothetical protein